MYEAKSSEMGSVGTLLGDKAVSLCSWSIWFAQFRKIWFRMKCQSKTERRKFIYTWYVVSFLVNARLSKFKGNSSIINMIFLVNIKGSKIQHLVKEISLFYFPGDKNYMIVCAVIRLLLIVCSLELYDRVRLLRFLTQRACYRIMYHSSECTLGKKLITTHTILQF